MYDLCIKVHRTLEYAGLQNVQMWAHHGMTKDKIRIHQFFSNLALCAISASNLQCRRIEHYPPKNAVLEIIFECLRIHWDEGSQKIIPRTILYGVTVET